MSARIDMSVGVTVGRISVGAAAVAVAIDGMDACVAVGVAKISGDMGVAKVFTEKLQASREAELITKIIINGNHLRCFIAFSLATVGV